MKILSNPFKKKKKATDKYDIYHPDIAERVEVAFEAGGVKYYRFAKDLHMPTGRYKYVYAVMREVDLRMDLNTLKLYLSELKKCLDGTKKTGIDLAQAWKLIFNMETRTELAFEPEGIRRLAAVCYFDDTEDLSTYDAKHGSDKIALWEKNNVYDFFLTRPISELLQMSDTSPTFLEGLKEYIQTSQQIIEDLNSGLHSQLSESSSEDGKKIS